ncbi:MAG: glycosyltransferase [Planctomycetia bacterium]|nr:MAG: glycosyltransferase [Planctomycetia bacterium]RIK68416.1 MAG: glycosyl transferase [Planctomycetota bacterium]
MESANPERPVSGNAVRIAVLVPCYNEAATIGKVVSDFRRELPEATVYVFDNNSTDGTGELARNAGAVVVQEKRQGKGFVVAAMLEKVDADCYVMVDGDDTYPAERVRDVLAPVLNGQADMVVGRREAVNEAAAYRRFHVFGNWLVRTMINMIFRARLTDILSGYRAFTREVARSLPIMAYGFDIETEMTVQCLYRKWVLREVPIAYRERPEGSVSKLSTFRDGFRVIFRILSLFRSYKPLTFFGGMGLALMALSMACGAWVLFGEAGADSTRRTLFIVATFTLLAMSLIAASIGVIVQLINFRFLELDSVLRRSRGGR